MKKKLFSLLVLLMTAVSSAWADDYFYMVISGTSGTLKYGSEFTSDDPYLDLVQGWRGGGSYYWENMGDLTAVTIDASCNNYNGTSLNYLFNGFSGLTTINGLDNLNTVGVQDMSRMFGGCSSLTTLDLSSFNTASATVFDDMFDGCSSLTTLDLSSWNTASVESLASMFLDCSSLTTLDLSSWNTASVESLNSMFSGCSSLTMLDLSSWNTAKVWSTYGTFRGCSNLENIYVGDGWSTAAVTSHEDMFDGCTKLLSMNTANPATNKTNAHTGDGGYLKVKPAGDYLFTVAPCEHGSGTVKFFVDEKEVKGANEGDKVTMTVTPEEGYVVGSVSANAYTTWAGARRTAPAIPMLGNVTLTPVEDKANTWTFTMPAASVELKVGYLVTSNLYLSKDALADKANITVKDGETTVEFDDDGKSTTTVIEGNTVTTKYNGTKKILGMKVAKKAAVTYPLLSAATTSDYGKVVCAAGHLHDAKTAVPDGCTAVGILGKVTSTGHGLILALQNATKQNWNTINGWTSVNTYAGTTLKVLPDDGARSTNLSSYETLGETTVSNWAVAQKSDYEAIFQNLGSTINDGGYTYDGNVNAYITTGVGGTAITSGYWSATYDSGNNSWIFLSDYWESYIKSNSVKVRPVLGF